MILDDFVREPRDGVADRLVAPELVDPASPSRFDIEDLRGSVSAPAVTGAARGGGADPRAARLAEIEAGGGELDDRRAVAEAMRGEAVTGATGLQREHGRRTDRAWFSERR